jgi:hypothetical protein
MRRHLLDTPSPVDDMHTLCGERLDARGVRRDQVTGLVAIVTCVACLRAYAASLKADLDAVENPDRERT